MSQIDQYTMNALDRAQSELATMLRAASEIATLLHGQANRPAVKVNVALIAKLNAQLRAVTILVSDLHDSIRDARLR
jgi:hypothetical protein